MEETCRFQGKRLLPSNVRTPTPQFPVELRIINIDRQTGKQFIIKLTTEDNRRRGVTITFLHGRYNEESMTQPDWSRIRKTSE